MRAFRGVGKLAHPFDVSHGRGAYLHTSDGRKLLDYVNGWGSIITGHAHKNVVDAIAQAGTAGAGFGMQTQLEASYAKMLCERSGLEMVRMVNSGTEACMTALRLARGHTSRSVFIKFAGAYHGHADPFLVSAGSGGLTFGHPSSAGVPEATTAETMILPYNGQKELESAFSSHGSKLAAVIIEPIAGNMSLIRPAEEFIDKLAKLCARHGALLISDEVMTGFRASSGLAIRDLYGVEPDLACMGKVIGGGLPAAALGGRREIMEQLAPLGPVYQAGTLSGNPVALSAGFAALKLLDRASHKHLAQHGEQLCESLCEKARSAGVEFSAQSVGAMAGIYFAKQPPKDLAQISACDQTRFRSFFHSMISLDVLLPPSMFEALFIGLAHDEGTLRRTAEAAEAAFAKLASFG